MEAGVGLGLVSSGYGADNDGLLKVDSWDKKKKSPRGSAKLSGFSQALRGKLPCIIESTLSARSDMENDSGITMKSPA